MNCNTALFERMKNIKMWKSWKTLRALCQERGSVFVLTAILLPVLCGFMGLAYDAGNLYMHKARLQNVTDAAALAAGAVYKERSQGTDGAAADGTIAHQGNHQEADEAAEKYLFTIYRDEINLGNRITIKDRSALAYQHAPSVDGNTSTVRTDVFYRVVASEIVPLYFLPVIMNKHEQEIQTASVVLVNTSTSTVTTQGGGGGSTTTEGKTLLDNLFTFSSSIDVPKHLRNYDYQGASKEKGIVETTFDGNIIYTNPNAVLHFDGEGIYKYLLPGLGSKGVQKRYAELIDQYSHYMERNTSVDINSQEYINAFKSPFYKNDGVTFKENVTKIGSNETKTSVFNKKSGNVFYYEGTTNGDLVIDNSLTGPENEPVYVMYNSNHNAIHMNVNGDSRRPIVFVWLGSGENLFISGSGTYRGVIYAPERFIQINGSGFKFYGNIISKSIKIDSGTDSYKIVNYLKDVEGFKNALPEINSQVNKISQTEYDTVFAESLTYYANNNNNANVNKKVFQWMKDNLGNVNAFENASEEDSVNAYPPTKVYIIKAWAIAYERTLEELRRRHSNFQLADLNDVNKFAWDDNNSSTDNEDVTGGETTTTTTSSSIIRLINPRMEDNPFFTNNSDI